MTPALVGMRVCDIPAHRVDELPPGTIVHAHTSGIDILLLEKAPGRPSLAYQGKVWCTMPHQMVVLGYHRQRPGSFDALRSCYGHAVVVYIPSSSS